MNMQITRLYTGSDNESYFEDIEIGLAVNIDHITTETAINSIISSTAVTIPVAFFLITPWLFHIRPHQTEWFHALIFVIGVAAILLVTFISSTILITGLITSGTVICNEIIFRRDSRVA